MKTKKQLECICVAILLASCVKSNQHNIAVSMQNAMTQHKEEDFYPNWVADKITHDML